MRLLRSSQEIIKWSMEQHIELTSALYGDVKSLRPEILRDGLDELPRKARYYAKKVFLRSLSFSIMHQNSMIDHARAAYVMLSGDTVAIWSPLSLARVVVESAVRSRYLLDPDASWRELMLRGAAVDIEGFQNQKKLSAYFEPHVKGAVDVAMAKTETALSRAGINVESSKNVKSVQWADTGQRVQCKVNVTELVKTWFDSIPGVYGLSSGAVHSGFWLSAGSLAHDATALRPDPDLLVLSALAVAISFRIVIMGDYQLQKLNITEYSEESGRRIAELTLLLKSWKEHMRRSIGSL